MQVFNGSVYGAVDTTSNGCRIATGNDISQTFFKNGASQHGCSRRAVTSEVRSFLSHFDNQFCSHVFESVFQFDFFGNSNTIFGDRWAAERFVDDHVTTGWAHCDRHSVSQFLNAAKHACSGVVFEQ